MMSNCKILFSTVIVSLVLTYEGIDADHLNNDVVVGVNDNSTSFECGKRIIVRCKGPPNSAVNWLVDTSITPRTNFSAKCFAIFGCEIYNTFNGRYSYTYDENTGFSDLIISNVTPDDDGREYKCSDGTKTPLKLFVKSFPENSAIKLLNHTSSAENGIITFTLKMGCTTEKVTVIWYSTSVNGTDLRHHEPSGVNVTLCTAGNCIIPGKSVQKSSWINLNKITNGKARKKRDVQAERVFTANISYDSVTLTFPVPGKYTVAAEYTTVTASTNYNNSSTPTVPLSITKTESSGTKTSITTANAPENASYTVTSVDDDMRIFVYVFTPVGGVIVIVISIYVICITCRKKENII